MSKQKAPAVKISLMLDDAAKIVADDRMEKYGDPRVNHSRTAALWSVYLGTEINARQVCMMNMLQKISRDAHNEQADNITDIVGYAACIAVLDT